MNLPSFSLRPAVHASRWAAVAAALLSIGRAQSSYDLTTEETGRPQVLEVAMDEVQIKRPQQQPNNLLRSTAEGIIPGSRVFEDGVSRVLVKLDRALDRGKAAARGDAISASFPEAEVAPVMYVKGLPRTEETRRIGTKDVQVMLGAGQTGEGVRALIGAKSVRRTAVDNVVILTFDNPYQATECAQLLQNQGIQAKPVLRRYAQKFALPRDKFFPNQWHLANTGQNGAVVGVDIDVLPTWELNRGAGATIAIIDDGLETLHADLKDNCPPVSSKLHHDFNDVDDDPRPVIANGDFHGTSVAGLAAAQQNNGSPDVFTGELLGVSGVAPQARLLGLRLIAGPITDSDIASALLWTEPGADVWVANNSWGYGETVGLAGADVQTKAALQNAATFGRSGRGQVTVFSAGNGRFSLADANTAALQNSRFVLTVGALNCVGTFSSYSTPGAPLLATAPGGGFGTFGVEQRCTTTDVTGAGGLNPSTVPFDGADLPNLDYTNQMNGTSSAAPITSGAVALMLAENPDLGWRDVQEIVASTARKVDDANTDWVMRPALSGADRLTNAAGFKFNHDYGGGLIDSHAATVRGKTWTNLGQELSQKFRVVNNASTGRIPDATAIGVAPNPALTRDFPFIGENLRVEHAEVEVRIKHQFRSDLRITLISPSGVRSALAKPRYFRTGQAPGFARIVPPQFDRDYADIVISDDGFEARAGGWVFTTTHHWGENSQGTWKVEIKDELPGIGSTGQIEFIEVRLFGTASGLERVMFDKQRTKVTEPATDPLNQIVTLRRLGPTTSTFTVGYTTAIGTATAEVDYTPVSGTVTFEAGEAAKDIVIPILPDVNPEPTETVNVVLTSLNSTTTSFGGITLATIDIVDDEQQLVTVAATDRRGAELAPELPQDGGAFVVTRSKVTSEALTVVLAAGGTATPGAAGDYNTLPTEVVIPPFEPSVVIPVTIRDDSEYEAVETLKLTVIPDATYQVGIPDSDTIDIVDNDRPKIQIVTLDNHATEPGPGEGEPSDTAQFQISRDSFRLEVPLAVFISLGGTETLGLDYILRYVDGEGIVRELTEPQLTNAVIIPAGVLSVNVTLIPKDDTFFNPTKSVVISLLPNDAYDFSFGFLTMASAIIEEDDQPSDAEVPTISVASPKSGAKFTHPEVVVVSGKAEDNDGVKNIQYRLNGGIWTTIPVDGLPSAIASWQVSFGPDDLSMNENILEVQATDIGTNQSKIATVKFTYIDFETLTVAVAGSGSVTKGFSPSSERVVGASVTITAKPGAGQVFEKWTLAAPGGSVEFGSRTLTFVMPDGASTLTASFIQSPFTTDIAGNYNGIVEAEQFSPLTSGFLTAKVNSTGAFTGKLTYAGKTYNLKGEFNGQGTYAGSVERKNDTPLTLNLSIDLNANGSKQISGAVFSSTIPSPVVADRAAYSKSLPAPADLVKKFNLFFPRTVQINAPQGTGYATMSISNTGTVKWNGRLPDGTKASQTVALSKNSTWPLFANLYKKRGVMLGTMIHDAGAETTDVSGSVNWMKAAIANDKFYPFGFSIENLNVQGSVYTQSTPVVAFGGGSPNAQLILENGNLLTLIAEQMTLDSSNKVTIEPSSPTAPVNPNKIVIKVNAKAGTFSGSFFHPVGRKTVAINGIFYQKTNQILGSFLGITAASGGVRHTGALTASPLVVAP